MIANIFYIASVVISIYFIYLFAYKTINASSKERILLPRIVYLMLLILSFVPILNDFMIIIFIVIGLLENGEDIIIDSWLFKHPGEK